MEITKIDDNTIKIVKDVITIQENNYSYGDLIKQRETIEAQKANEIKARDAEILEVEGLIAECEKLGMTTITEPVIVIAK